jgi:mannose-6-phosphate isomerase class I
VLAEVAAGLVRLRHDNFVERPWGGDWIRRYKQVGAAGRVGQPRWGEAFEISAFDADAEAKQFPSLLTFADGSSVSLPALLQAQGSALLGEDFVARHGSCFPLLPKTLCVKELLSVQGHPPGNTEVYIIIDAEPGATLRLGFSRDIDAGEMSAVLSKGLGQQRELLDLLGSDIDGHELHAVTAPWFADPGGAGADATAWIAERLGDPAKRERAAALLTDLKALYWTMLDSMNAIEVQPGQVIYNATPARLLAETGGVASAEVHALGNPEGKEILALEIRRPGPTFRAWDNVRFPQREVDVEAAIEALNLRGSKPTEFICELTPVAGREGAWVSVDCEFFRVEHLKPDSGLRVDVPAAGPHALHCLAGAARFTAADGRPIGELKQGESAFVPAGVGAYRVESDAPADVVRVTLPES